MSMIDPTTQTPFGPEVRREAARKLRQSSEATKFSIDEPRSKKEAKPDRPDKASEVLQRVAERALENPPRDMHKLAASAAKFLLINLEPALRLAEELRMGSLNSSGKAMIDMLLDGRQSQALKLLTR